MFRSLVKNIVESGVKHHKLNTNLLYISGKLITVNTQVNVMFVLTWTKISLLISHICKYKVHENCKE